MNDKQRRRFSRAKRSRSVIKKQGIAYLGVHKTLNHIYAKLISPCGTRTLVTASTIDKEIRCNLKYGGNKSAAVVIGKLIAQRCLKIGIEKVAFDRSGFKYHGRIKALADAAREGGLDF